MDKHLPPVVGKNGKVLPNFANLTTGQVHLIRQSWKIIYTSNVTKHMHRVTQRASDNLSNAGDVARR